MCRIDVLYQSWVVHIPVLMERSLRGSCPDEGEGFWEALGQLEHRDRSAILPSDRA